MPDRSESFGDALYRRIRLKPPEAWTPQEADFVRGYQESHPSVFKRFMRPLVTPEMVKSLPGFLQPVGNVAREFTSPASIALTLGTAGLGPAVSGGLKGAQMAVKGAGLGSKVARGALGAGRFAALPIAPKAGFVPRVGAELGVGMAGAATAMEVARRTENAPLPIRVGAPLVGGLAGGLGAMGAARAVRPAVREVPQVARQLAREEGGFARLPGGARKTFRLPPPREPFEIPDPVMKRLKSAQKADKMSDEDFDAALELMHSGDLLSAEGYTTTVVDEVAFPRVAKVVDAWFDTIEKQGAKVGGGVTEQERVRLLSESRARRLGQELPTARGQAEMVPPVESAAPVAAPAKIQPAAPPPAVAPRAATAPAKPSTTGLTEAFRGLGKSIGDSYVDSMWDYVRRGSRIPLSDRPGLEKAIQDAADAGQIKSPNDIAALKDKFYPPKAAARILSPNEMARVREAFGLPPDTPLQRILPPEPGAGSAGVSPPTAAVVRAAEPPPPLAQAAQPPVEPPKPPKKMTSAGNDPDDVRNKFSSFLAGNRSRDAWEATKELRAQVRAQRVQEWAATKETLKALGYTTEEAFQKAQSELKGMLPMVQATFGERLVGEWKESLFRAVDDFDFVAAGLEPGKVEYERLSTLQALKNALEKGNIPSDPGAKGGSARSRLERVFGKGSDTMKALTKGDVQEAIERKLLSEGIQRQRVYRAAHPERPYSFPTEAAVRRPSILGPQERLAQGRVGVPFGVTEKAEFGKILPLEPAQTPERISQAQQMRLLEAPRAQEAHISSREYVPEKGMAEQDFKEWLASLRAGIAAKPPQTPNQREWLAGQAAWDSYQSTFSKVERDILADEVVAKQTVDDFEKRMAATPDITQAKMPTLRTEEGATLLSPRHQNAIVRTFMERLKPAGWTLIDIGNFLRANKASVDLSFPRQMAPFLVANAKRSLEAMAWAWRATWDKNVAAESWAAIQNHPYYRYYEAMTEGGKYRDFLRPPDYKGRPYWQVEESGQILASERILGRLANRLPWITGSQRSFVTGSNHLSWGMFVDYVDKVKLHNEAIATGKIKLKPGEAFDMNDSIKRYSAMLSDMGGRASLGPLRELSPAMNAGFFSIRHNLGRALSPRHLISPDPFVRKEAWKNMISFVGTMGGVILLGQQFGLWDTEVDPRSTDFMKIRVGKTRIDPWGGYQQFATFLGRLMTGERISAATGGLAKSDVYSTAGHFIRSKLAPAPGLFMDFKTGRNFLGQPLDVKNPDFWLQQMAPFSIASSYEAFRDGGIDDLLLTQANIVGAGTGTYGYLPNEWEPDVKAYRAIPTDTSERYGKFKAAKTPQERTKYRFDRLEYRQRAPQTDAKLFIIGDVESLQSAVAVTYALRLIKEQSINPMDVKGIKNRIEEKEKAKKVGRRLKGNYVDSLIRRLQAESSQRQKVAA